MKISKKFKFVISHHTLTMEISFNRNGTFSAKEKQFITRVLTCEFQDCLKENEIINVLNPIHHSRNDTLPHFTFRIFDKRTDVRDIAFLRFRDYHAYVWTEENDELTLEFITQYVNRHSILVF